MTFGSFANRKYLYIKMLIKVSLFMYFVLEFCLVDYYNETPVSWRFQQQARGGGIERLSCSIEGI
jgi:hypothetical protein